MAALDWMSAAPSNACRALTRDHAAPEPTLRLTKAFRPWLVGVRPLAWCSRPRAAATSLDAALVAHGGTTGLVIEVAFAGLIVAIALAVWVGGRRDKE
jgi:hypothetical protein